MAPIRDGAERPPPPHVLREYALIADGERGALIGPAGDLAWMCAPAWHSGAVFSALLGGRGAYSVTPTTDRFTWGGYYENGTLIWHSRWTTTTGVVECREAMAFPADPHRAIILRRVMAVHGDARVRVVLTPTAEFDRHRMSAETTTDAIRTMRAGPLNLRWTGAKDARCRRDTFEMVLELPAGAHHDLILEVTDRPLPEDPPDARTLWRRTEQQWRASVPAMNNGLAERDTRHAYAVLRGLTSATGGMVAAATTALPERADQGRNYDYRYCWIRDQCYVGQAIAAMGPDPLLDHAVAFVSRRLLEHGPELAPAYTVTGAAVPGEVHLDLPGYPGAGVRVGNHVNEQFQLDTFGEALLLFAAADRHDRLDREHWKAVEIAAAAIEALWHEPDAGIWELEYRRWAHSRLICAAGLRAVAGSAPAAQSSEWARLADRLVADASGDCLHPSGRWQRAPEASEVDAALLLPAVRGAVSAGDSRSRLTLECVRTELGHDGYLYRFRHPGQALDEAEGAFLLCGFVMALAEHQQGNTVQAARWFERNRAACGPAGLFTEEFDVVQRQLRGNVPQAFVHGLLIESAHRLAEPWAGS